MAEPGGGPVPRRLLFGVAALGALVVAGCAPALVQLNGIGGPIATTPSASPPPTTPPPTSPAPSSPSATSTSATPTPTPTLPPLTGDTILLNGSSLSFQSPAKVPGWKKTLFQATPTDNRTLYDSGSLHMIVELTYTGLSAADHARQLAGNTATSPPAGWQDYRQLALGDGPQGGYLWAFSYVQGGATNYAIDWFQSYDSFDAAIYLRGPIEDRPFIQALWRAVVDSAYTSAPYQSPAAGLLVPFTPVPTTTAR